MQPTDLISINIATSKQLHNESNNTLLKLPTEIFYDIMDILNISDLQNLSWTCRLLYHIARKYHFGVIFPIWEPEEISQIDDIPIDFYRHGVWLNDIFYLPIFRKENPICWLLDLTNKPIKWFQKSLIIDSSSEHQYEPIKYYASTAIKNFIYIFGGENTDKGITTNIFYELNVYTFIFRVLNENNDTSTPAPRMMHTLDAIDNHRLATFGGLIIDDKKFSFDSRDFAIYDIKTKSWNCYVQESNIPYRRSLPCSHFAKGKLYIYGGQKYKFFSNSSEIHDDEDISVFDFYKDKWYKLLNLSIEERTSKMLLPPDWILTKSTYQSPVPGKRLFSGMFTMNNRIAIFGGSKKDGWNNEEVNRPWELMYLLSTVNHHWEYIRIKNLPQIEVMTIYWKGWDVHEGLFLIGKDKKEGNPIMGWVRDSKFII